jgi:hypothetical protein
MLFLILIFILDYVFIFLSMQKYKNNISSSCLECSLERDIFIYLIIGISVFYILFIVLSMIIKKKYYLYGAIIISLLSLFYYVDYVIFVDRVSSWSTYCIEEIFREILMGSYIYIPIVLLTYTILVKLLLIR